MSWSVVWLRLCPDLPAVTSVGVFETWRLPRLPEKRPCCLPFVLSEAHFWPSWSLFWALLGPILGPPGAHFGPLIALGAPGPLRGRSWVDPGLLLGRSWALLGSPWRPPGPLLAALGPLWAALGLVLAASWASFGASWAALGRRKRVFTKPCKNHGFSMVLAWFLGLWGPSWGLLAASGGALGGPWSPLGRLGCLRGRPGLAWASVGPS